MHSLGPSIKLCATWGGVLITEAGAPGLLSMSVIGFFHRVSAKEVLLDLVDSDEAFYEHLLLCPPN